MNVATSYLDPSLKGFVFVKDTVERRDSTEQTADIVKENAMSVACTQQKNLRIVMLR